MTDNTQNPLQNRPIQPVYAGEDQFGEHRGLGISAIQFKLSAHESSDIFIIENAFHKPGGPARHLHFHQDEWFFALEGEFVIEIGDQSFMLKAGDSILAPRNIPHVWAYTGHTRGRMLIVFTPAGKMEAFFREVTQADAMPPQDPALWLAHDMQLMGPPLKLR